MPPVLLEIPKPAVLRTVECSSDSMAKTLVIDTITLDDETRKASLAVDWKSIHDARIELNKGGGLVLEELPDAETAFKLLGAV